MNINFSWFSWKISTIILALLFVGLFSYLIVYPLVINNIMENAGQQILENILLRIEQAGGPIQIDAGSKNLICTIQP